MNLAEILRIFKNRQCLKGNLHLGQPLNMVCIDDDCAHNTIVCSICQKFDHHDHRLIPYSKFAQLIVNGLQQFSNSDFLQQTNIIDLQKLKIMKNIKTKMKVMKYLFQKLQMSIEYYFENIRNQLKKQFLRIVPFKKKISNLCENVSDTQSFIKNIEELLVNLEFQQEQLKRSDMSSIIQSIKKKKQFINSTLSTIISSSENQFDSLFKQLEIVKKDLFIIPFTFDPNLRGSTIIVNQTTAKQNGSSGQRFALMSPKLSNKKVTRWGMKVINCVGWIGFGVCLKQKIENAKYNFNYNNLGHGSYLISHNMYCWNQSFENYNSKYKGILFHVNDTIYIQFDPIQKKLVFVKNQNESKFEMQLQESQDTWMACANITSIGDTVEIVNTVSSNINFEI